MDITFGYDQVEDRIWMKHGSADLIWFTRRMAQTFLIGGSGYLERTVGTTGLPHEPPVSERVRFDHEETLSDSPEGVPAFERNKVQLPPQARALPERLVRKIDITVGGDIWVLAFHLNNHPVHNLGVNRLLLHRVLSMIQGVARRADWQLKGVPEWLSPPEGSG
jgi:hypothetical protein